MMALFTKIRGLNTLLGKDLFGQRQLRTGLIKQPFSRSHPLYFSTSSPNNELVLGLDINTNSTGYSICDLASGKIISCGLINTEKEEDLFDKAALIKKSLTEIRDQYNRTEGNTLKWHVGVEDFLKAFHGLSFRTKDLFSLAQINSLVSYDCIRVFDKKPIRIPVRSARSYFGIKKVEKEDDIKEIVLNYVTRNYMEEYEWKKTRTGKLHKSNFDIADSVVITQYLIHLLRGNVELPQTKASSVAAAKKAAKETKETEEEVKAPTRRRKAKVDKTET